jgi:Flp pilus assembly secretin CpaC
MRSVFTLALASLLTTPFVWAVAPSQPVWALSRPDVVVPQGQTLPFALPPQGAGIERLVVGDGNVAEVLQLPNQNRLVLINGKKAGITNFLVWLTGMSMPYNYKVEVVPSVRDESIAVQLQVLELTQRKTGNVGVNWSQSLGFSEATPNMPFRLGLPVRTEQLQASLKLLAQQRDVHVLAQPTLVIQNGKKAEFLAGGELPIPIAQGGLNGPVNYSVQFHPYWIKLEVEPKLEEDNAVTLALRPEVSAVDQENAIKLQTLSVPAIATRWVNTSVRLKSGESIAIAGLLRKERNRVASKLPWLGDLPFIGYVFGNAEYDERESELVFLVTPLLVNNNNSVDFKRPFVPNPPIPRP